MYINIIHKKNSTKKFINYPNIEIYIQNFKLCNIYFLSQIYFIYSSFSMFVGFIKIINYFKYRTNKIYLKQTKIIQDVMSIRCKIINCKKIICVTPNFGDHSVHSPMTGDNQKQDLKP